MTVKEKSPRERSQEISQQLSDLNHQKKIWEAASGVREIQLNKMRDMHQYIPDEDLVPWQPLKEMVLEFINQQIVNLQSEFATL